MEIPVLVSVVGVLAVVGVYFWWLRARKSEKP
jgi:hypothetical protein